MARGEMRSVIGLLLIVNFLLCLLIIGLASWAVNKYIDGVFSTIGFIDVFGTFGNNATPFELVFALLGGAVGVCSVMVGFVHHRAWSRDTLGIATSSAIVSFSAIALALGFASKEIKIGGDRGDVLKTLEVVIIVSTFFQLLYLLLLHSGMYSGRHGPTYS